MFQFQSGTVKSRLVYILKLLKSKRLKINSALYRGAKIVDQQKYEKPGISTTS